MRALCVTVTLALFAMCAQATQLVPVSMGDACMGNVTAALGEVKAMAPEIKNAVAVCKNATKANWEPCGEIVAKTVGTLSRAAEDISMAVPACGDKTRGAFCADDIAVIGAALSKTSSDVFKAVQECRKGSDNKIACLQSLEAIVDEAKVIANGVKKAIPACKKTNGTAVGSDDKIYFVLALQKCDDNSPWTMHGLWPQYSSHNWPSNCGSSKFEKSKVEDLWSQITTYWETCPQDGKTEEQFLEHEWSKHGTCAASALGWSQHKYFQVALQTYAAGAWKSQCDSQAAQWHHHGGSGSKSCKVPYHNLA